MLERLLRVEEQLARIEALLLVFFVLLMLGLAVYNVFYRNVLVPIQVRSLTEEVAAVQEPVPSPPDEAKPAPGEAPAGEAQGFGGGFDEPAAPADDAEGFGGGFDEPAAPADDADGFGGGFDEEPAEPEEPAQPEEPAAEGFAGGFGGGFEPEGAAEEAAPAEPEAVVAAPVSSPVPAREPPFIARAVDALKLEWIDVLLRQLVLLVGFLGATLATKRRKHITIDALSKLLSDATVHKLHVLTNLVSLTVCVVLLVAGLDFVAIGLEYPRELVSWAMEWQFQLIFPIGFGLLALHFAIRVVESGAWALGLADPPDDARGTPL